jgi:hypothetical protein
LKGSLRNFTPTTDANPSEQREGITLSFIQTQYNYAKSHGWLIHFANAAAKHGHTTADLMAIASRETNMRNIVGDNGHGYGVMQIDIRSFADFCTSGKWKDVEAVDTQGRGSLSEKAR